MNESKNTSYHAKREKISANTKAALQTLKENGVRLGRAPALESEDKIIQFAKLYNKGLSTKELMEFFNLTRSTVCKYINIIKEKKLIAI